MIYYIHTKLHTSFEQSIQLITEALKIEGFGILTEISIHEKLKEKLGVNFRNYKILGACHPEYAYKALLKEDKIGTMLPCNIIVQELAINDIEVAVIDTLASVVPIENVALANIAKEIRERLVRVINSLQAKPQVDLYF